LEHNTLSATDSEIPRARPSPWLNQSRTVLPVSPFNPDPGSAEGITPAQLIETQPTNGGTRGVREQQVCP